MVFLMGCITTGLLNRQRSKYERPLLVAMFCDPKYELRFLIVGLKNTVVRRTNAF